MFKRKKKPEAAATWTSSTDFIKESPIEDPKPVQFTARQLAFVHALIGEQRTMAMLSRASDETLKIVDGALTATHTCMREWWRKIEGPEPSTVTVKFHMTGSPEGKPGEPT